MLKLFSFRFIVFLIILLSSIGCRQKKNKYVEFTIQENSNYSSTFTSKENDIKRIELKSESIYGSFTNIAVVDSFLICGNLRSPKLISLYSLNGDTLITEILKRGTALHEGLSVAGLYIQNNMFFQVYDITLGKLFKIDIYQAIKDTAYVPEKEANLTGYLKNLISPEIITDSLILATTYALDDNRYIYTDTKKVLKKVGNLPKITNGDLLIDPPATKFPNRAYIFKAIGIKHPVQNKAAVFYNKADRAEFYSNDTLVNIVIGQEKFGPKMQVTKLKEGYAVDEYEKSQFAYLSIAYTDEFIYCLYAGNRSGETCANRIIVFDWNGKFINELSLDRAVCKICIDPKRKILYCYENKENGIFSADLNL